MSVWLALCVLVISIEVAAVVFAFHHFEGHIAAWLDRIARHLERK